MDLSEVAGSFITSVSTEVAKTGALTVRIVVGEQGGPEFVIVLSDVVRLCIDGGDLLSFISEAVVRRLPCSGAWPAEARHLLGFHDNVAELVWVRLHGPTSIEVVARGLWSEETSTVGPGARSS